MMIGKERAEAEGTQARDELQRGLDQAGFPKVPEDVIEWGPVRDYLMDAIPGKRENPDAYDTVATAIMEGPPIGGEPPEGDDEDLPF